MSKKNSNTEAMINLATASLNAITAKYLERITSQPALDPDKVQILRPDAEHILRVLRGFEKIGAAYSKNPQSALKPLIDRLEASLSGKEVQP